MPKLLLVLAMVLVQVQPWVGVLLCDQQMRATDSAMASMEHHAMPDASHLTGAAPEECPALSACAAAPSAVVQVLSDGLVVLPSAQDLPWGRGIVPDDAFPAPPFHPPSA